MQNKRILSEESCFKEPEMAGGNNYKLLCKLPQGFLGAELHILSPELPPTINGYDLYFKNYLQTLPAEDRPFIEALLPNLLDWFIQAGSGGMTATAGDQAAFMLDGVGSDTLTGKASGDLLADEFRDDLLFDEEGLGGHGKDVLLGSRAEDNYRRMTA